MTGAISAVSAAGATAAAASAIGAGIGPVAAGSFGLAETAAAAGGALAANAGSIASIVSLAGTGISALGQMQQGKAASAAAKYNATMATQNANLAGQVGEQNVANEQMKTRAQAGAIMANEAAKGVDVNSGSAVGVHSSAAALGELNALTIRSQAAQQAYGYQSQAAIDKSTAANDTTAGDINAAGTAFKGLGEVGMQYFNPRSGIGTI